ncbi:MAG: hypothetical protein PQJ61_00200 [Spirochaetales bacterium]|uniref:Twin-arginine translocase subunit TatB n=1 Tax=Candidatus Thalassospirochaeta sargassi TaxID=3119039 RepID=A0AAJ1I9H4_9SPIO|nr:hypothetical protein [Spirochaetales bacterium]
MANNGIGFSEILIILVIFLIFVRPSDMPKVVRTIGKIWAKFYLYFSMFKREMRNMEKEIGIEDEMKEIRAINAQLNSEVISLRNSVNNIVDKNELADLKKTEISKEN